MAESALERSEDGTVTWQSLAAFGICAWSNVSGGFLAARADLPRLSLGSEGVQWGSQGLPRVELGKGGGPMAKGRL